MDKKELIERIEDFPCEASQVTEMIRINKNTLLGWAKQLDEPQKVKIPQFVANWIEYCKNTNVTMKRALLVGEVDFYNFANQKDESRLIDFFRVGKNQEIFARAWLDGYTVEEKRYRVRIKGVYYNSCLIFDKINKKWFLSSIYEIDHQIGSHTRKELEQAGFGWVFDCPGIEIEEVE